MFFKITHHDNGPVLLAQVPKQGAGAIDIFAAIVSRQRASPSALPLGEAWLKCDSLVSCSDSGSHIMHACVQLACLSFVHMIMLPHVASAWPRRRKDGRLAQAPTSPWSACTGVANEAVTRKINIKNLDNRRARFALSFKPTLAQPFPGPGVTLIAFVVVLCTVRLPSQFAARTGTDPAHP